MAIKRLSKSVNSSVVSSEVGNMNGNGNGVTLVKEEFTPEVIEAQKESCELPSLRNKLVEQLNENDEIDELTSLIDLGNSASILEFGKKPAEDISRVADGVLANYGSGQFDDVSKLVENLVSLMKKVDLDEINEINELMEKERTGKKKGLFSKLFQSAGDKLDKIVSKYNSITSDIDKICMELANYEAQIKQSNIDINKMYNASIEQYKELVKYVVAGEQAVKEIAEYRDTLLESNVPFEVQSVTNCLNLMEQRVADLKSAEAIALQSIPSYKVQEFTNANLARKVNSAFIITIPVFKSALTQAILTKQQAIQAQGLAALDLATNELIKKNAENMVSQLKISQELSSRPTVSADTIEQSWNTIMNGIIEYKNMEEQYRSVRKDELSRIEACNEQYLSSVAHGSNI